MRFSIRSRAVAWPTGWISPLQAGNNQFQALPPPIHV